MTDLWEKKITTYRIDLKGTDKHRAGKCNTKFSGMLYSYPNI